MLLPFFGFPDRPDGERFFCQCLGCRDTELGQLQPSARNLPGVESVRHWVEPVLKSSLPSGLVTISFLETFRINFDDLDEDGQTAAWAWVAAIAKEGRCRNDEDFIVAACKFIREQLVPEKKREIIQKLKRTKPPPAV